MSDVLGLFFFFYNGLDIISVKARKLFLSNFNSIITFTFLEKKRGARNTGLFTSSYSCHDENFDFPPDKVHTRLIKGDYPLCNIILDI